MAHVRELLKRAKAQEYVQYPTTVFKNTSLPDACLYSDVDIKVKTTTIGATLYRTTWQASKTNDTGNGDTAGSQFYILDPLVIGTSRVQRVGQKVRIKAIHVSGVCQWQPTVATANGAVGNFALVLDKHPANRQWAASYLYCEDDEVFVSAQPDYTALALTDMSRYQVLARERIYFEGMADDSGYLPDQNRLIDIRLNCDIPAQWSTALDLDTELQLMIQNRLFIMIGGSGVATWGDGWQGVNFTLTSKVYFSDD